MCRYYRLTCSLCNKTDIQLYYCTDLVRKRAEYHAANQQDSAQLNSTQLNSTQPHPTQQTSAEQTSTVQVPTQQNSTQQDSSQVDISEANTAKPTTISLDKPIQHDCPTFNESNKAVEPAISYAASNGAASKHVCTSCDFEYWYELEADDAGGREVWSDAEFKKRVKIVRMERLAGARRERKWIDPS